MVFKLLLNLYFSLYFSKSDMTFQNANIYDTLDVTYFATIYIYYQSFMGFFLFLHRR